MTRITLALAALGLAAPAIAGGHISYEDMDGDGMWSFSEITTANPDISMADFQKIDADGDGMLSQQELDLAIESGDLPV